MLHRIVDIIKGSTYKIEQGTLFCKSYIVTDIVCIEFLVTENVLENALEINQIGATIDLELSLAYLNSLGFYEDCETFILKNKYCLPSELFYINEINCFSTDDSEFIQKYMSVIALIDAIKKIAKHTFIIDADIENSIIFNEDQSTSLPFIYNSSDIKLININDVDCLNSITDIYSATSTEKKLMYINQVIELLNPIEEIIRFKYMLSHIVEYYNKCNNAYQYYLRDFSYNKLKIELDSKALEYTQKIQSVINDSQTKLIAIPTAFILVFAVFDFTDLFAIKNIATILSLFIFALLIQLFLSNQKSTLNFIKDNIDSYKETFNGNIIESISSKFTLVEIEYRKQRNRLRIVEVILWAIPVCLLCLWLFLINLQAVSVVLILLFIVIVAILKIFMR